MQKIPERHRVLGRSIGDLDVRDPSLINLPLPVNSVPVVGSLASPLVGNSAGGSAQSSPPVHGNGHGGGNGNGHGGGSGGGNGQGNGGGGGSGGGGSTPVPIASPTSGGGTAPPPDIPGPLPSNPAPGIPPGSSSAKNSSGGVSSPSSPSANGNFLGAGQTAPVNVESGTPPITSAAPGASTAAVTGFSSLSQYLPGSSTNTIGAAASMPTITTLAAVSSGKRLSAGAVAGISLMCLLFLIALTLLVIRRRSIAHRLELRRQWWFNSSASAHSFNGGSSRNPVNGEAPASRLSARSSFATNFDQGLMFRIDSPTRFSLGLIPDLPPTVEVRERNSVLMSTGGSVARRESLLSMLSNGSDPGTQYLTIPAGHNNLEPTTPMSVRPFSPSESFAFPKPPQPSSSAVDSSFTFASPGIVSPQSSATTLVHLSTPPRAFMTDLPPGKPQASAPSITVSPFIVGDNPSADPFMDPPKAKFPDVEVVRRPFAPSLDDEMAVVPGDRVGIIRVFDDGWAFVEKLTGTESERHERGLIPVDCFRNVDQVLPAFHAERRVSYGSQIAMGTAL